MLKIFEKVFGSKHDKDIKKIQPVITTINELQGTMSSLGDDQLREKGRELKKKVRSVLEPLELEKKTLSQKLDNPDINIDEAETVNVRLDTLAEEYERPQQKYSMSSFPKHSPLSKRPACALKASNTRSWEGR